MKPTEHYSDERLNAFVDGELDGRECDDILAAAASEPALKQRLCELRAAKNLVRHAYGRLPAQRAGQRQRRLPWSGALAAGVALLIGIALGWSGHRAATDVHSPLARATGWFAAAPARVLIHLDDASMERMEETLDIAEAYLAKADHTQVEVVVNNSGINLLRGETSPYAQRIAALSSRNELISFVACGYAISRYRKSGQTVTLLPAAKVESSAVEHIVDRMRQGWTYVKI